MATMYAHDMIIVHVILQVHKVIDIQTNRHQRLQSLRENAPVRQSPNPKDE